MTWVLATEADFLYLDQNTGELNGTPTQNDVGDWVVNISVIDDHGGKTSREFILTVIDLNEPPIIITKNKLVAYTNQKYLVEYKATDADTPQDLLIWELSEDINISNATWLSMDSKSGVLRGTPLTRHIGWYWVTVKVSDDAGGADHTTFKLDVLPAPNRPPELLTVLTKVTKKSTDLWSKRFNAIDDYTPDSALSWFCWILIYPYWGFIIRRYSGIDKDKRFAHASHPQW